MAGMATLSVVLAVPATAAPTPTSVPGTCVPYPVQICRAHIAASTTTPRQGQTIEVSGTGYVANENVSLTIGGISVGTAHTDSHGNFDPPVVVPATLIGNQPLTGTGASHQPSDVDSLVLDIQAAGAGGSSSANNGGGGLASTGVEIAAFSTIGAVLILAGIAFAVFGRRRRSAHGS
jgi:LPXTG-motif cell wall-anchored protein